MAATLLALLVLQAVSLASAFPGGAPASSCVDMTPRHAGVQPQPDPAPYHILTSSPTFQTGQNVTVVIAGAEYRALLLEARAGTKSAAVGSWSLPPADTKLLQCSGNPYGAITHAGTSIKDGSTTYTWTPPSDTNTVYFIATVAQQRNVFWLNIKSDTLTRGERHPTQDLSVPNKST
uniref:Reelin domain-containing protein n=1 Tax=Denticeps clupeoides TaxID=299321 RepID=A0AAY4BFL1_9TELE